MKKQVGVIIGIFVLGMIAISIFFNTNKVLRVGVIGDFSSGLTTTSVDSFRAIEVAVEELNEENESYELVRINQSNMTDTKKLKDEIIALNLDVLVGPSTSSQFMAIQDVITSIDIPVFLISVSTNEIYDHKDNIFRITDTLQIQVETLHDVCKNYIHLNNIQIFYTKKNSAYSKAFSDDFENLFNSHGGIANTIELGDFDSEQVRADLLKSYDVDGFLVVAGPGEAGIIADVLSKNNIDKPIVFSAWSKSDSTLEYARHVKNPIYTLSISEPIRKEAYEDFVDKLYNEKNISMSTFTYFGYEIMYFMDFVLKETKSTSVKEIQEFVHTLEYYKGNFNDFTFNRSGDGGRGYSLMEIKDGSYHLLVEKLD